MRRSMNAPNTSMRSRLAAFLRKLENASNDGCGLANNSNSQTVRFVWSLPCPFRKTDLVLGKSHPADTRMTQDVREVGGLHVQHVREVHREPGLDVAEDEAVREAPAVHAVERGGAVRPLAGEREA